MNQLFASQVKSLAGLIPSFKMFWLFLAVLTCVWQCWVANDKVLKLVLKLLYVKVYCTYPYYITDNTEVKLWPVAPILTWPLDEDLTLYTFLRDCNDQMKRGCFPFKGDLESVCHSIAFGWLWKTQSVRIRRARFPSSQCVFPSTEKCCGAMYLGKAVNICLNTL